MNGLEKFKTEEEIIRNTIWICKSCDERIRMREQASDESLKKYVLSHLKTCECDHDFSDWKESNMGTWPEIDMMTWRTCSKCGHKEHL